MVLWFCHLRDEFKRFSDHNNYEGGLLNGASVVYVSVTVWLPVLLNEELQRLSVGEHDIRIDAEVVVACGILTAEIPNKKKKKT